MLRGRCRDCACWISPRYAIVEAVVGGFFFVLAYVELFSGGANLPEGPLYPFSGAMEVVWVPQWSIIALYGYHCFLLCFLVAAALIDQDQQPLPYQLVALSACIIVLGSWNFPSFYPEQNWLSQLHYLSHFTGTMSAILGSAMALAVGLVVLKCASIVRFRKEVNRTTECPLDTTNQTKALAVVGGFLGIHGASYLCGILVVGIACTKLFNSLLVRNKLSSLWSLWVASLVLIVFWRHLTEMFRVF